MKTKYLALPVLLILCLCACASILGPDKQLTAKEYYLEGLQWYNYNLDQYRAFYEAASPETQAKLTQRVSPIFRDMSRALNVVKIAIGTMNEPDSIEQYLAIRNLLIKQLILNGVILGGEKND